MSYQDDNEQLIILRKYNRALRSVNTKLRRSIQRTQDEADEAFVDLCETQSEAEIALEKIRMLGEISCSPGDYSKIVEQCLVALDKVSHRLTPDC